MSADSALGAHLSFFFPYPPTHRPPVEHINVVVRAFLVSMLMAFAGSPPSLPPSPIVRHLLWFWMRNLFLLTTLYLLAAWPRFPSVRVPPKCIHSSSNNNWRCHPLTRARAERPNPESRSKGTGANHLTENRDREREIDMGRGEERRRRHGRRAGGRST